MIPLPLIEELAAYAHKSWSGWMRYLFEKSQDKYDGVVEIPSWAVVRWRRQMSTEYRDLPDEEKKSDVDEATIIYNIVKAWTDKTEAERDEARRWARRLYDKANIMAQLADVNAKMAFRVMRERDELKQELAELRRELEAMRQPPADPISNAANFLLGEADRIRIMYNLQPPASAEE